MFSVLGFAYMIRGKLGQKIEFKIFLFIIIGISAAILYQFTLSTQKLQSNLTGTKVEYIETDPNLNISISICNKKSSWPMENITELENVDSIFQRSKGNTEWIEYKDSVTEMFTWSIDQEDVYSCKTMKFTGEEIKIVHFLYQHDAIFLHDPGFISGGTSLKLTGPGLYQNRILLLNAKQIQRIEEDNVCSNSINYDSCRDDNIFIITQEFNKTFGCIMSYLK